MNEKFGGDDAAMRCCEGGCKTCSNYAGSPLLAMLARHVTSKSCSLAAIFKDIDSEILNKF